MSHPPLARPRTPASSRSLAALDFGLRVRVHVSSQRSLFFTSDNLSLTVITIIAILATTSTLNNSAEQFAGRGLSGPDVTTSLGNVLGEVRSDFERLPPIAKVSACASVANPINAQFRNAWDINPLDPEHRQVLNRYCTDRPRGESCFDTVAVRGECFVAADVNFVLFGTIASLCNAPLFAALDMVRLWKASYGHSAHNDTEEWTKAGYAGWPSAATPSTFWERSGCRTAGACSFNRPLSYRWDGVR